MTASHSHGACRALSWRLVLTGALALSVACSASPAGPGKFDGTGDSSQPGGTSNPGNLPVGSDDDTPVKNVLALAPSAETHESALKFVELCSACHGDWGEGSSAPSLWKKTDRAALIHTIDVSMPPKDPTLCSGACAEQMADYILSEFSENALACASIRPAPRQLRLLNRREYANSVRSLFASQKTQPSEPTPNCGSYTFRFSAGGDVTSVSVAGTFNSWSDSAWPMTYSAADQAWTLSAPLADGSYEFKYVLRKSGTSELVWQADPALPQTGGFGNSALTMHCESTGDTGQASADFDFSTLPSETRPLAFPFDTTVTSVVGTQQFEAYFDTAKKIAFGLADLSAVLGCDLAADRAGCGRTFVTSFGKRVFRRPLTDAEITRYLALVMAGDDADVAVRTTLSALLISPGFLYRGELGVAQKDGTYLLTPYELASALSYLLTADMPDEQLMAAADSDSLQTEQQIRAQAMRLLLTAASRGALSDFVLQWLGVSGVAALSRSSADSPDFTNTLLASMREETRGFAEHVLFDGEGTLNELVGADYTFVNRELAALYGLNGQFGDDFVQTKYADGERAGVLGQASVLATFSHADQTSPVLRGLFVRRQLLCQRFGEPPPNAGSVPEPDPSLSTRERFDMHSRGSCAGCHTHIDTLGFGFEAFDMLGKLRDHEGEHAIDSSGDITGIDKLSDTQHESFSSPRELAPILLESAAAHDCVAKQSYRFTRGALDNGLSYCAVKFVRQRYRESKGQILEALLGAVEAVDFRYRY